MATKSILLATKSGIVMIRQIVLNFIATNDVKIALYMSTIYVRSDQQMFVFIFWERIITKKCVHAVKRAVRE